MVEMDDRPDRHTPCVICGSPLGVGAGGWEQGNNAAPVADGQCCDACDKEIVTAERMRRKGYNIGTKLVRSDDVT